MRLVCHVKAVLTLVFLGMVMLETCSWRGAYVWSLHALLLTSLLWRPATLPILYFMIPLL